MVVRANDALLWGTGDIADVTEAMLLLGKFGFGAEVGTVCCTGCINTDFGKTLCVCCMCEMCVCVCEV